MNVLKPTGTHLFAGGLPMDAYTAIVNTASEVATLAVYKALESGALRLSQNAPAPSDSPGLGGDQSETDAFQPFRRTFPHAFCGCLIMAFLAPPGKTRVPRPNQDKLVDVCYFYPCLWFLLMSHRMQCVNFLKARVSSRETITIQMALRMNKSGHTKNTIFSDQI